MIAAHDERIACTTGFICATFITRQGIISRMYGAFAASIFAFFFRRFAPLAVCAALEDVSTLAHRVSAFAHRG